MHILINTREIRNPCAIRPKQIDTIIAGFDHTKRHRRCTDANLPSFVLLNGVIGAAFAPTLAPTLALVLLGKGEDTDVDVDRSSIGGRRSLSISDFRLWTTPCNRPSPQMRSLEKGGREGGEEEEDHARIVERLDGVLDALGTERERAIRQPRRARYTLELRHAFRFLTVQRRGRSQKGKKGSGQRNRPVGTTIGIRGKKEARSRTGVRRTCAICDRPPGSCS